MHDYQMSLYILRINISRHQTLKITFNFSTIILFVYRGPIHQVNFVGLPALDTMLYGGFLPGNIGKVNFFKYPWLNLCVHRGFFRSYL